MSAQDYHICPALSSAFTDNEVNTFTLTVEITADDGIVFQPKIIEKGGENA